MISTDSFTNHEAAPEQTFEGIEAHDATDRIAPHLMPGIELPADEATTSRRARVINAHRHAMIKRVELVLEGIRVRTGTNALSVGAAIGIIIDKRDKTKDNSASYLKIVAAPLPKAYKFEPDGGYKEED